jgi:hypothetical protein
MAKPVRNLSTLPAKDLGCPTNIFVSKETYAYFAEHKKKLLADYERWEKIYNEWRQKILRWQKCSTTGSSERCRAISYRKF